MSYPNIRAEMARNRYTIKKLASFLGISAAALSRKLNGKKELNLSELDALAELFGCSLDYLAGHERKE